MSAFVGDGPSQGQSGDPPGDPQEQFVLGRVPAAPIPCDRLTCSAAAGVRSPPQASWAEAQRSPAMTLMYFLVAALLGFLAHLSFGLQQGDVDNPVMGLAAVSGWVLLASLLRSSICQQSKISTLIAGMTLAVAWTLLHVLVSLALAIRTASAIKAATPVDIAVDRSAYLVSLIATLPLAVVGAFVLRSLPRRSLPIAP